MFYKWVQSRFYKSIQSMFYNMPNLGGRESLEIAVKLSPF